MLTALLFDISFSWYTMVCHGIHLPTHSKTQDVDQAYILLIHILDIYNPRCKAVNIISYR